jgi:hypothetical protein
MYTDKQRMYTNADVDTTYFPSMNLLFSTNIAGVRIVNLHDAFALIVRGR